MTDPTEAPQPSSEATAPPPPKETAARAPEVPQGEGITAPPASPPADAPADAPAELVVQEPPIAPGVPRLERPAGTARTIPETILGPRPSPSFLAVVSIVSLASDIITKLWAEKRLEGYPGYINVFDNHLMFVLAKNKGGAWGLLQGQSENVRRPFFLLVSVAAIAFIVTLYRRLQPRQHALKWGLPLVLGGALGNVFDRIRYGFVIDFIDYRADWIKKLNELIQKKYPAHIVTDHWPTFNVADIAICVGVALMAIDMLTSRRGKKPALTPDVPIEAPGSLEPILATEGPADPTGVTEPALAAEAGGEPTAAPTTATTTTTDTESKTAEPT
ncbi:MAG: signal peptidase [Myxococcales bacterium]|jgi:signal peptidase II|nr:signal peptidase [Myxococcales bacterium]